MEKPLKIPAKKHTIVVWQLTEDINQQQLKSYLAVDASYIIITGFIESYALLSVDRILLVILANSKNKLVDVCLPYVHTSSEGKSQKTLARYIIFDSRLLGIRLCCRIESDIHKCEYTSPPGFVQQYYRHNRLEFKANELLVGCFYLQAKRCRIGFLFESQLLYGNTFMEQYNRNKCDILSISANVPNCSTSSKNGSLNKQKQALKRLKELSIKSYISLIYAGPKIAPTNTSYYVEKSFIMQGNQINTPSNIYLGLKNGISFVYNIELTLKKKLQTMIEEQQQTTLEMQRAVEQLYLDRSLAYYDKLPILSRNSSKMDRKYFDGNFNDIQISILNLWYTFKTINRGSPFVISYPFTEQSLLMYNDLVKLQQYTMVPFQRIVKIYRYKEGQCGQSGKIRLKIYNDFCQMIDNNKELFPSLIYVYTNDQKEVRALRSNLKFGDRICNCSLINHHLFVQNSMMQGEGFSLLQKRKMENASAHVLNQRYQSIDDILEYFRELNFSVPQIQHCFVDILPKKIKRVVKPFPIYLFLIHEDRSRIINEIGQAELRLQIKIHNKDEVQNAKAVNQNTSRQQIEMVRRYKSKILNQRKCHSCGFSIRKNLLNQCSQCQQYLCFECIDSFTGSKLPTFTEYKCLVCSKQCRCNVCLRPQDVGVSQQMEQQQKSDNINYDKSGLFLRQNFSCTQCIIMNRWKALMMECDLCKKLSCFICSQSYQSNQTNTIKGQSNQSDNIKACKECLKLKQLTFSSAILPMPVAQEKVQQKRPEKEIEEKNITIEDKSLFKPQQKNLKQSSPPRLSLSSISVSSSSSSSSSAFSSSSSSSQSQDFSSSSDVGKKNKQISKKIQEKLKSKKKSKKPSKDKKISKKWNKKNPKKQKFFKKKSNNLWKSKGQAEDCEPKGKSMISSKQDKPSNKLKLVFVKDKGRRGSEDSQHSY